MFSCENHWKENDSDIYIYKDKTQVVFVRMERRKLFSTVSSLNFKDFMLMERRKLFLTVSCLNFRD